MNGSAEVYRNIPSKFDSIDGRWGMIIQFDKIKDFHLREPLRNLELIKARIEKRSQIKDITTGDYIMYADGVMERVTHVWDDSVQGGGGQASYYMSKTGSGSYSGGLNRGVTKDKLESTNEFKDAMFWMFSDDWAGAHRGVDFVCPVRVWKTTECSCKKRD